MLLELAVIGGASHVVRRVRPRPRLIDQLVPTVTRRDWQSLKQQTGDMSEEERSARAYFLQTSVMLGGAAIGMLVNPSLLYLLIPGIVYTTYPLFRDAWRDLVKKRRFTVIVMDVILSSLSVVYGVINPKMLALTTFSNWLYSFFLKVIAVSKSHEDNTLAHLSVTEPETVWVLQDQVELSIPFRQLAIGDVLVVDSGQIVPVDGMVLGEGVMVDQSRLSSDGTLLARGEGEIVFAGSVLRSGRLFLQVTALGEQTALAEMRHIYEKTSTAATDFDLRGKALADRFALPGTLLGAAAYPITGLDSVMAVMMLSPCYTMRLLGLLTIMDFLKAAAQEGMLIKDGRVFEQIHKVDTLVLDTSVLRLTGATGTDAHGQVAVLPLIAYCHRKGITVWLVSDNPLLPDSPVAVATLAQEWNLGEHYQVLALPQAKAEWVSSLQAEGGFVAYVGDGICDVMPMKCANVSISLSGISTLASDTADIIVLDQSLLPIQQLFELSKQFEHIMARSLLTSTVPNVLGIAGTFAGAVTYAGSIGLFYGGMGLGLLNVFWPQLRRRYAALTAANETSMINTSVPRINP